MDTYIQVRITGTNDRRKVKIKRHMSLHGIPGFALHKSIRMDEMWTVSHIETGARVAGGNTIRTAEMLARQTSKSAKVLQAGINLVRELSRKKRRI